MLTNERAASISDKCLVAWATAYRVNNPHFFKDLFLMPWMITEMFDKLDENRSFMGEQFYLDSVRQMAREIRDGIARYRGFLPGLLHSNFDKPLKVETPCATCEGTGWGKQEVSEHDHGKHCFKYDNEGWPFNGYRAQCPRHDVECKECQGLGGLLFEPSSANPAPRELP